MKCTSCGSDNTQRLQVIYEGGTQTLNAQSAYGNVTATTQSALARKATPPKRAHCIISAFFCLVGLSLAFFYYGQYGERGVMQFWVAVCIVCGWMAVTGFRYNNATFPQIYKRWQNSWMCLKCGNIYQYP
jgi:hypothetical protein